MKRMTLVAVALCLLVLTTVGAGVVVAKQGAPGPQTKYNFDVTFDQKVVGTVTIDANKQTFNFKGTGLTAGTEYFLVCDQLKMSLGSATATKGGIVQIKGTLDPSFWDSLTENPTFLLSTSPPSPNSGCTAIHFEADSYTLWFWGHVSGKVTTLSGAPVPAGGQINIWTDYPYSTARRGDLVATTYTEADGGFSYTKAFWSWSSEPWVSYDDPNHVYCDAGRYANGA